MFSCTGLGLKRNVFYEYYGDTSEQASDETTSERVTKLELDESDESQAVRNRNQTKSQSSSNFSSPRNGNLASQTPLKTDSPHAHSKLAQSQHLIHHLQHRPNPHSGPDQSAQATKQHDRHDAQRDVSEETTSASDSRPDLTFHDFLRTIPFPGTDETEFGVDVGGEGPGSKKLRGFEVKEGGDGWS